MRAGTADTRNLDQYCNTERQREVVAMVRTARTVVHAAELLGMTTRGVFDHLERIRRRRDAAEAGAHEPNQAHILPGQKIKGVSTMVKTSDGLPQWIKTTEDTEALAIALEEMREGFAKSLPKEPAVPAPTELEPTEMCNLLLITDYHLGMYAWAEETGHNWDMQIAEDMLVAWIRDAIRRSPPADMCVFAQLGDFLHYDSLEALTPTSGHILDADSRSQLMVRIAIRVLRRVTRILLDTYPRVHIIHAEGNHDLYSSAFLREVWDQFYSDEPRLTIETSPDPYYSFEWGSTSLFFHHGHKRRPRNIETVVAGKFRDLFGRTEFSYCHLGHMHNDISNETNLMIVEQHQTLAAPDAHASRGGWLSERSGKSISYHKRYGEVTRTRITPRMIGHK